MGDVELEYGFLLGITAILALMYLLIVSCIFGLIIIRIDKSTDKLNDSEIEGEKEVKQIFIGLLIAFVIMAAFIFLTRNTDFFWNQWANFGRTLDAMSKMAGIGSAVLLDIFIIVPAAWTIFLIVFTIIQAKKAKERKRVEEIGSLKDIVSEIAENTSTKKTPEEESEPTKEKPAVAADIANELREYKSLLDDGILTQEEFDKKKSELLGL